MPDLLITKTKHHGLITPKSEAGKKWVEDTFEAKEILGGHQVCFNIDVLEDWVSALQTEDLDVEVK